MQLVFPGHSQSASQPATQVPSTQTCPEPSEPGLQSPSLEHAAPPEEDADCTELVVVEPASTPELVARVARLEDVALVASEGEDDDEGEDDETEDDEDVPLPDPGGTTAGLVGPRGVVGPTTSTWIIAWSEYPSSSPKR
jgi:hypothetical protein